MKRYLAGAVQVPGPKGFGGMQKWLITGALIFGIAPLSLHAQDQTGTGQPESGPSAPIAAATLFGLPAENGRVKWPVGLWMLSSDESKALRDQLELVLYYVATQAAEGKVNPVLIDFGRDAVHDLRRQLRPRKGTMYPDTYAEAMRFLDRAERGLTKIKTMDPSPGGAHP